MNWNAFFCILTLVLDLATWLLITARVRVERVLFVALAAILFAFAAVFTDPGFSLFKPTRQRAISTQPATIQQSNP